MRSMCKKGTATLVAVLALCALTAASASAAQWYVGGKALSGSEKLAETVKIEEPIKFSIEPEYGTLTCTGMTVKTSEIGAGGTIKLNPEFSSCALVEPYNKHCTLEGGNGESMRFEPLEAKLAVGKSPEDSAELASTHKNEWFEFAGNEQCTWFAGVTPIEGTVTIEAPKGQTEATEQEFTGLGSAGKALKWYSNPVYLTGKLKLKLASGKAWSFH